MYVYFDNCVIIDIQEGKVDLQSTFIGLNDPKPVYSLAHLFEVKQKSSITDQFVSARCKFIAELTGNRCVTFNQPKQRNETHSISPFLQYEQIKSEHLNVINESLNQLVPLMGAIRAMEEYPLKTIENNNLVPIQFIGKINSLFIERTGKNFAKFIDEYIALNSSSLPFNVGKIIETVVVFHLIDELGFHPDKKDKIRTRMWDALHVHFASACDVFITSDEKTYHKAQACFDYFNSKTRSIHYKV